MPRRSAATIRPVEPDPLHRSKLVQQVINRVMLDGKKSTAERIVYDALAIIAEHLGLDWHAAHVDDRLVEIGMGQWGGRYYADVAMSEAGPIVTPEGLLRPAPDGERYDAIAARVGGWLADTADEDGDRLVISHGISSRVLRGLMTGADAHPEFAAPIAPGLPQGSVVLIEDGRESVPHLGTGHAPA